MDNQKMNNNRPDQDPEGGNNKKDDMNKKSLMIMVILAIADAVRQDCIRFPEGSDIYRIYAGCQGWKGDEGGTGFGPHLL